MNRSEEIFTLAVEKTANRCPIGETVGKANMQAQTTPVYSCEGACIRGEIARRAANLVAKSEGYRRGCHGELLTVPASAIARWTHDAEKIVLIDGCYLRCHGRIMEKLLGSGRLVQFDALSHHKRYTDIFDMDDVPEDERNEVALGVADWVLGELDRPAGTACSDPDPKARACCESG